jgi:hypothetical protein
VRRAGCHSPLSMLYSTWKMAPAPNQARPVMVLGPL